MKDKEPYITNLFSSLEPTLFKSNGPGNSLLVRRHLWDTNDSSSYDQIFFFFESISKLCLQTRFQALNRHDWYYSTITWTVKLWQPSTSKTELVRNVLSKVAKWALKRSISTINFDSLFFNLCGTDIDWLYKHLFEFSIWAGQVASNLRQVASKTRLLGITMSEARGFRRQICRLSRLPITVKLPTLELCVWLFICVRKCDYTCLCVRAYAYACWCAH